LISHPHPPPRPRHLCRAIARAPRHPCRAHLARSPLQYAPTATRSPYQDGDTRDTACVAGNTAISLPYELVRNVLRSACDRCEDSYALRALIRQPLASHRAHARARIRVEEESRLVGGRAAEGAHGAPCLERDDAAVKRWLASVASRTGGGRVLVCDARSYRRSSAREFASGP
jgi:hypothetical protein